MVIRKGMWVRYGDRVGILVNLFWSSTTVQVHLVNERGETVQVVEPLITELVQASYADIPKPRRPPKALATRLGYV